MVLLYKYIYIGLRYSSRVGPLHKKRNTRGDVSTQQTD